MKLYGLSMQAILVLGLVGRTPRAVLATFGTMDADSFPEQCSDKKKEDEEAIMTVVMENKARHVFRSSPSRSQEESPLVFGQGCW